MTVIEFYKKSAAFRHYFGQFLRRWHKIDILCSDKWANIKEINFQRDLADDALDSMRSVIITYLYDIGLPEGAYDVLCGFVTYLLKKLWAI